MSFPYRPGPPPGHQAAPPPVRSEEPASPSAASPAAASPAAGSPAVVTPAADSSVVASPAAGFPAVASPAEGSLGAGSDRPAVETGHPAVDEVLRSLENAAQLPPAEQIAEFEAAHQVLRETLASIDG